MYTLRLEAVRTDTNEQLAAIDLREPITSEKIIRHRQALRERVALHLGAEALPGLVDVSAVTQELPPSDLFPDLPAQVEVPDLYLMASND